MVTVPKLWPGSTVAILAGGPSLTQADVDFCRGRARVIAIKDAIQLAPWADVLYACDAKWWRHYAKGLTFTGPRYSLETESEPWASVLRNTGEMGLEIDPTGLRTGRNSGYQAINLAVHLGATRIVLLGYDMRPVNGKDHWFGPRPPSYWTLTPPYKNFLELFPSIVAPLQTLGVEVLNATPGSALTLFPAVRLEDAFVEVPA